MRGWSPSRLLDAWEQSLGQPPVRQAIVLLAAACPGVPLEKLARLSVGQRDACLLALREWAFGPHLACLTRCPVCAEQLELTLSMAELRLVEPCWAAGENDLMDSWVLISEPYEVEFRLPNSRDLALLPAQCDLEEAREWLLGRCIVAVREDGSDCHVGPLPATIMQQVVEEMGAVDPQGDVELDLRCPACDHHWTLPFDIAGVLWRELDAWALRTLREVHLLASAYGWREGDILALSPWRRQFYLDLVGVQ
jgi:hypothetical protein